jgi:cyclopropane fatty-acyl-phospholipid synthase-like methyltransferase
MANTVSTKKSRASSDSRRYLYFRRHIIPKGVDPAIILLFREMNKQQVRVEDVASRAGLHEKTIDLWKSRTIPRIDNLRAALGVLGITLRTVKS